jgi:hypothetical protein
MSVVNRDSPAYDGRLLKRVLQMATQPVGALTIPGAQSTPQFRASLTRAVTRCSANRRAVLLLGASESKRRYERRA